MKKTVTIFAIVATAALAISACGSGGSSSTKTKATTSTTSSIPKLQPKGDGSYVAHVKDEAAANAACDNQHELGLQLKKLGASTKTTTTDYGQTVIHENPGVFVEVQYGPVDSNGVTKNVICLVKLP